MSEHTLEPWFYTGSDIWNLVPDNNGEATQNLIANASENDARRIVACVNACAGIETETIESVDSDNAFRSLCSQGFARAFKAVNP